MHLLVYLNKVIVYNFSLIYHAVFVIWLLGYSVAVGEFNGDEDEGKK